LIQANKDLIARAELLALAIEHFCTTDVPMDEKLQVLADAESDMEGVKQSAAKGRQKLAELKAEATSV
jgi:hypothetical protein